MTLRPSRALLALTLLAMFVPAASAGRTPPPRGVAAGSYHGCALRPSGGVVCWGSDQLGQLGNGAPNADSTIPALVSLPTGRTATAITDGLDHACALLDDGSVACWGSNTGGELGADPTIVSSSTPVIVPLPPGRHATSVSAGTSHTCALLDNASAVCWGDNASGELGVQGPKSSATPLVVTFGQTERPAQIVAGNDTTCAVLASGGVDCWGSNGSGQLGNGGAGPMMDIPGAVHMPGGVIATSIALGTAHACALTGAGMYCWGSDSAGQLGDDAALSNKFIPVLVRLPPTATPTAITAGGNHTCTITASSATFCWGANSSGELGVGSGQPTATPVPVPMPAGRSAAQLSAGGFSTCAVLDDDAVVCWGKASATSSPVPVAATAPTTIASGGSADLSLTLTPAGTTPLAIGEMRDYTVTVTNAGSDTATGVAVAGTWNRLGLWVIPTASQGMAQTLSSWSFGAIPAGGSATLVLHLIARNAGATSVTAEISADTTPDPDSTPGNHVASEDDQATAPLTLVRAADATLTVALTPTHARRAPYAVTISGTVASSAIRAGTACAGTARITVTVGTRTAFSGRTTLKLVAGSCRYSAKVKLTAAQRGKARTAKVTVTFAGNAALLPAVAGASATFRFA